MRRPTKEKSKYDYLQGQCRSNGWKASYLPIEVGERDFTARWLCNALSDISVIRATKSRAFKSIYAIGERTAKWIWFKSSSNWKKEN